MESEFARAIIPVMVIGLLIVTAGTVILFLLFRAMGDGRSAERKHVRLSIVLVVFLFICCGVFYAISLR